MLNDNIYDHVAKPSKYILGNGVSTTMITTTIGTDRRSKNEELAATETPAQFPLLQITVTPYVGGEILQVKQSSSSIKGKASRTGTLC